MKYAETVAEIGVRPLRRRDVNALRLALECVRSDAHIGHARLVLSKGGAVADEVCSASYGLGAWMEARPLRARLALLLRCLLRVDAGDYGPSGYVDVDDDDSPVWAWEDVWPANRDIRLQPLPIRPLWQDAPGGQR